MTVTDWLSLVGAAALLGYLFYALLRSDKLG